jgi:DNA-binding ferritin-like protein
VCLLVNKRTNEPRKEERRLTMIDLTANDLLGSELEGATKRKTQYRIKRKKRMTQSQKSRRNRSRKMTNSEKSKKNRATRLRRKTDQNFRNNQRDYQNKWRQKNKRKRGSVGYSLPFDLKFLFQGKEAYLMSLSEVFDAVNIYIEGETAILVNLNDFLEYTEWYSQEDLDFFIELIESSYAVFDEDESDDDWSDFSLDENIEIPAKNQIDKSASQENNLAVLQMLLAVLRAAHFAHWTSHWQVKGQTFYSDHELMERIYTTLIEEIDTLAEKIVGTYGVEAVNAVEQAQLMANHLLPLAKANSINEPLHRALLIEEGLQVIFKNSYDMLKEQGGLTLGMDDFLMSMANTHETNLYLLRQRCS